MAIKVGTENKRNVILASVLLIAVIGIAIYEFGGSSPAPAPAPVTPVVATAPKSPSPSPVPAQGPAATRIGTAAPQNLDPSLRMDLLAQSETVEYAGNGRNIFSADSAPVAIEQPVKSARNQPAVAQAPAYTPPPAPVAPAIDLHYFGYSTTRDGKRRAFLIRGEDIYNAGVGEIVNHRYKIVAVNPNGCQITDLSYNNTQTVPFSAN
jgi:hypothetical protein